MPISDSEKLDFLWKKTQFGAAKTAPAVSKFGSNETIPSPTRVFNSNVWAETDPTSIPATPPSGNTSVVALFTGANAIRMTMDTTAPVNRTWLAAATFGDRATLMTDFIPPTFGAGYAARVWIGNPFTGPAARIFPDTNNEEWVFDYVAGVLHFATSVPADRTATVGSGTVSVATHGIYIEVYRYIGARGVPTLAQTNKIWVVPNIASRDALVGLRTGDLAFVQDASAIPADAGPGESATYIWLGSSWAVLVTSDAARSDALTTGVTINAPVSLPVLLGRVGNGARVVNVTVEITTPFTDGVTMTIGDGTDSTRLMTGTENDLQTAGVYVAFPSYQFPFSEETEVFAFFSSSATVGSAKIVITYA